MKDMEALTLRDLYPHLSDEELAEAEYNLERYLKLVMRIGERLQAEGRLDELTRELGMLD